MTTWKAKVHRLRTESDFISAIDFRFPYGDEVLVTSLIEEFYHLLS